MVKSYPRPRARRAPVLGGGRRSPACQAPWGRGSGCWVPVTIQGGVRAGKPSGGAAEKRETGIFVRGSLELDQVQKALRAKAWGQEEPQIAL